MNDSNYGELPIATLDKVKKGNWKLNTILVLLVFVIIGLFGILGSMGQLYKKLNYVESFCSFAMSTTPEKLKDIPQTTSKKSVPSETIIKETFTKETIKETTKIPTN